MTDTFLEDLIDEADESLERDRRERRLLENTTEDIKSELEAKSDLIRTNPASQPVTQPDNQPPSQPDKQPDTSWNWDSIVDEMDAEADELKVLKLRNAMQQGGERDPNHVAKSLALTDQINKGRGGEDQPKLTPSFVERNYDQLITLASENEIPISRMIELNPKLAAWLSQPDGTNVALANDDLRVLMELENQVTYVQGMVDSWRYGVALVASADMGWAQLSATFGMGVMPDEDALRRMDAMLTALQYHPSHEARPSDPALGQDVWGIGPWVGEIPPVTAEMLPFTGAVLGAGIESGLKWSITAGSGAALLSLGPQGAVAPITVGAAALAGGVAGTLFGSAMRTTQLEAGLAFREYMDLVDESGNKLDSEVAAGAALLAGVVNGGVEILPLRALARVIPGVDQILSKAGKESVREGVRIAMQKPRFRTVVKRISKRFSVAVATEGVVEAFQELSVIAGAELAKLGSGGDWAPFDWKEALGRVVEAGEKGVQGSIGMSGSLAVPSAGVEIIRTQNARNAFERRKKIIETAQGSVLRTRQPKAFEEFYQSLVQGTEEENILVDPRSIIEYLESVGEDPIKFFDDMDVTPESLKDAVDSGGDVKIDHGVFVSRVADHEHRDAVLAHTRADYGQMTMVEAEAVNERMSAQDKERNEESLAGLEDDTRKSIQGAADQIFDHMFRLIQQSSMYDNTGAKAVAELYRQFALKVAVEYQKENKEFNLQEFFDAYNLELSREGTTDRGKAKDVDLTLDPMLEELRSKKGPTQREMFGQSLQEFVRERGIDPASAEAMSGEIRHLDIDSSRNPGERTAVREGGLGLDDLAVAASEAGYFPLEAYNEDQGPGTNELLELLDQSMRSPVYSENQKDQAKIDRAEALANLDQELSELDIDLDQPNEVIRELMAQHQTATQEARILEDSDFDDIVEEFFQMPQGEEQLTPQQRVAAERWIDTYPDADAIYESLEINAGTPYADQAWWGAVTRMHLEDLIAGREVDYTSALDHPRYPRLKQAAMRGEEAVWAYLAETGMIGSAGKPVNSVNSTFMNCRPSRGCAKFCYATGGHYRYDNNVAKGELVNWAIERDPVRAGKKIAQEYKGTAEFHLDKALRLQDKGDLGPEWIPFIKTLNSEGVRVQVFSKRPELLRQVSDFNLRLLSVDDTTSQKMASENPDLGLALVYQGPEDIPFLEKFADQIQVILPVKYGSKVMAKEQIDPIPKKLRRYICPVDGFGKKVGKTRDGKWNCTRCDLNAGIGCFHGTATGKKLEQLKKDIQDAPDELKTRVDELLKFAEILSGEERQLLLGRIDLLVSALRRGVDLEKEEGVIIGDERSSEGSVEFEQSAWHASPKRFGEFSLDFMSEGTGTQAFGWGLYFAEVRSVAEAYKAQFSMDVDWRTVEGVEKYRKLVRKIIAQQPEEDRPSDPVARIMDQSLTLFPSIRSIAFNDWIKHPYVQGALSAGEVTEIELFEMHEWVQAAMSQVTLYEVAIPDNQDFLYLDGSITGAQSQKVTDAIREILDKIPGFKDSIHEYQFLLTHRPELVDGLPEMTGADFYRALSKFLGSDKAASLALDEYGLAGNRYLDAKSREKLNDRVNERFDELQELEIFEAEEEGRDPIPQVFDHSRRLDLTDASMDELDDLTTNYVVVNAKMLDIIEFQQSVRGVKRLFSMARHAVRQSKQKKQSKDQWYATMKNGGVKDAELDWIPGLDEFLSSEKSISREDLANFIENNGIILDEHVRYNEPHVKTKSLLDRESIENLGWTSDKKWSDVDVGYDPTSSRMGPDPAWLRANRYGTVRPPRGAEAYKAQSRGFEFGAGQVEIDNMSVVWDDSIGVIKGNPIVIVETAETETFPTQYLMFEGILDPDTGGPVVDFDQVRPLFMSDSKYEEAAVGGVVPGSHRMFRRMEREAERMVRVSAREHQNVAKWGDHTSFNTPLGRNQIEFYITLPSASSPANAKVEDWLTPSGHRTGDPVADTRLVFRVRANTRTYWDGESRKRMLHIDEMQAERQQAARRHGWKRPRTGEVWTEYVNRENGERAVDILDEFKYFGFAMRGQPKYEHPAQEFLASSMRMLGPFQRPGSVNLEMSTLMDISLLAHRVFARDDSPMPLHLWGDYNIAGSLRALSDELSRTSGLKSVAWQLDVDTDNMSFGEILEFAESLGWTEPDFTQDGEWTPEVADATEDSAVDFIKSKGTLWRIPGMSTDEARWFDAVRKLVSPHRDHSDMKTLFAQLADQWEMLGMNKRQEKVFLDQWYEMTELRDFLGVLASESWDGLGTLVLESEIRSEAETNEMEVKRRSVEQLLREFSRGVRAEARRVPPIPFGHAGNTGVRTEQWTRLALKRMLVHAVENNYDSIAWTEGATQVERYDDTLHDVPTGNMVQYKKLPDGKYEIAAWQLDPEPTGLDIGLAETLGIQEWGSDELRVMRELMPVHFSDSVDKESIIQLFVEVRKVLTGEGDGTWADYAEGDVRQKMWQTGQEALVEEVRVAVERAFPTQEKLDAWARSQMIYHLTVSERELPTVVGELMAKKIISAEGIFEEDRNTNLITDVQRIVDNQMDLRGKGFRKYYDSMVVNTANDLGKKFGESVESTPLGGTVYNIEAHPRHRDDNNSPLPMQAWAMFDRPFKADSTEVELIWKGRSTQAYDTEAEAIESARDDWEGMYGTDAIVTELGPRKVWRLDINDNLRETIIGEGLPMWQDETKTPDDPRGSIRFEPNRTVIHLFRKADPSTLLHESGHLFLRMLADVAQREDAPQAIKDNYQDALDWLGARSWDELDPRINGDRAVELQEKWAVTFEEYLFSGKAPSAELISAFARFKAWLLHVYRTLTGTGVEVNDQIRRVFDRLLATEEQIELAETKQNYKVSPEISKLAGEDEAKVMQQQSQAAHDLAVAEVEREKIAAERRETQKWWREEKAKVREEVEQEVWSRKIYKAWWFLTRGEFRDRETPDAWKGMKLDLDALKRIYGDGISKMIPRSVPPIAQRGGENPDQVASALGYGNLDEFIQALTSMPKAKEVIEEEVNRIMAERHGDPLNDGSMEAAAMEEVHNDPRKMFLEVELRVLGRKAGKKPTTRQAIRELVDRIYAVSPVKDLLKPLEYARRSAAAGRAAERALVEGDFETAFIKKREQLVNHELFREGVKAKEEVNRIRNKLGKRQRKKIDPKNVAPEAINQIKTLLSAFAFGGKPKEPSLRATALKEVKAWMQASIENDNAQLVIVPELFDLAERRHWRDMTIHELRALRDTVDTIYKWGKQESQEGRAAFKQEMLELAKSINDNAPKRKKEKIFGRDRAKNRYGKMIKEFLADLRKFEFLARELDGAKFGKFWDRVWKPLARAGDLKNTMLLKATEDIAELFKVYSATERMKFGTTMAGGGVWIEEIGETLTKEDLLSVALNWGNDGNRKALMDGYGWNEAQVKAVLSKLDARDWDTVQNIWDYLDSYWSAIEDLELRTTGVTPSRVERLEFMMPLADGKNITMRGGYYPLKYDPELDVRTSRNTIEDRARQMLAGGQARASTSHGHTIERTGSAGQKPVMSLSPLFQHLEQVIQDLTHREVVLDINNILRNPEVAQAILDTSGKMAHDSLEEILKTVAAGDIEPVKGFEKMMRHLRIGISVVEMGLNLRTVLTQPLGLTQSISVLNPKWVGVGLLKFWGKPHQMKEMVEFVDSRSTLLRLRKKLINREVRDVHRQLTVSAPMSGAQAAGFWFMIMMDCYAIAYPTWIGAYEKAMAQGKSEQEAIDLADGTVRITQATGDPANQAMIQQRNEFVKLLTLFYSYFSTTYNLQVEAWKRLGLKGYKPAAMARFIGETTALQLIPAVMVGIVLEPWPDRDDDEDGWVKFMLLNLMSQLTGTMPVVRDVGNATIRGFGYALTPASRPFELGSQAVRDIYKGVTDEDTPIVDKSFVKGFARFLGYLARVPGMGQIVRTGDWIHDYNEGELEVEPTNVVGAAKQMLLTGDRK